MNNYIDAFRDPIIAEKAAEIIKNYSGKKVTIMEVCGTHTMSIFRYGLRSILPENIKLVSGPGCPVCVTPSFFINAAIELSKSKDVIVTTFGDMMRVPGKESSLLREKALGGDIRIVYSPLDSLKIAKENPDKKVVFLSIGFETTTPISALAVTNAEEQGIENFSILSANKTMPEALKLLVSGAGIDVDGFLYPGHVSAIMGTKFFEDVAKEYNVGGVIAGFEALDLLQAIIQLSNNINNGKHIMENLYSRIVTTEGNTLAMEKVYEVFEPADAYWRGIGNIKNSGLRMKDEYKKYDAWEIFGLSQSDIEEPKGCICGEVLMGKKIPSDCKLFGKKCIPENPVGSCMVSSEGTCAAFYKYNL